MIVLRIPKALDLEESPILTKFLLSLPAKPCATSEEIWKYAAKMANAKLDWENRQFLFNEKDYLMFLLKWS